MGATAMTMVDSLLTTILTEVGQATSALEAELQACHVGLKLASSHSYIELSLIVCWRWSQCLNLPL